MIAKLSASLVCGPKFIVPRHNRLTCRPVRPRDIYCMLLLLTEHWQRAVSALLPLIARRTPGSFEPIRSATGQSLQLFGIASSLHHDFGSGIFDLTQVVRRQFKVSRTEVLLQAVQLRGAWDGNNPGLLRQQPRQRDLGGRCVLAL